MEYAPALQLLDATLPRLTRAQDRGLASDTTARLIVGYTAEMRAAIEAHEDERDRIYADTSLSEGGQHEAAQAAFERAEQIVNDNAQKLAARAEDDIKKAQRRATPQPPAAATSTFETQLANARTDARMVLDPMTDQELHAGLANLAQTGSEAMRHLILGTDWPDLYLRSRNSRPAEAAWANQKHALMPLVLDEDGTEAMQALQAAPELRAVAKMAQHAAAAWARDANSRNWTRSA